jgi:hypothetical protein
MDRRRFLLTSQVGAFTPAGSQAGQMPHVISLLPGPPTCEKTDDDAFDQALRGFGFVPGHNLRWDVIATSKKRNCRLTLSHWYGRAPM